MKNLLLIFICFSNLATAQVVAFEVQYKEKNGAYAAKLSTYNQLIVMVEGMSCDDFFLTTDNGILQKHNRNCTWYYLPYEKHYGWIYLNKIVEGDTIVFHKKRLKIQLMEFVPVLAPFPTEQHTTLLLTKKQLLSSRLYMLSKHKFYDDIINLASCNISIERNSEIIFNKHISTNNYEIYMETIDELLTVKSGDIFIISQIQYEYPNKDGAIFIFDTYNIEVKIQ